MHLFWKFVDANYFDNLTADRSKVDPVLADLTRSLARPSVEGSADADLLTKGVSLDTLAIVGRLFKPRAFQDQPEDPNASTNFRCFALQAEVANRGYGALLRMAKTDRAPCEFCAKKLEELFMKQWGSSLAPGAGEAQKLKFQMDTIEILSQLPDIGFCQRCSFYINPPKAKDTRLTFEAIQARQTQNKNRIGQLMALCESRKRNTNSLRANFVIYREIETQKRFIQQTLLELEKKILAESIFKVSHARKTNKVEVWLAKPGYRLNFRLKELLEMDRLRENSLFKISKTTMKCHSSYFSYNVGLPALRRRTVKETAGPPGGRIKRAPRAFPGQVPSSGARRSPPRRPS